MQLPVMPPVKPMLAKAVKGGLVKLPDGPVVFEPKWDGFRCIVFRDGDEVELGSRNERPLTRYFPEMLEPLRAALPDKAVVDGELIVVLDDSLGFDALQQRIHPAESRVNMLAEKTPASFVAFDLLAVGDESLMETPFEERRRRLEEILKPTPPLVFLTPTTDNYDRAQEWFDEVEGAGLDGLIAKPTGGTYEPDKRSQFKLKHERTVDVVVAGYRIHKDGEGVGSLLLGLHDDAGNLHHLGVAASFAKKRRAEFLEELSPLNLDDLSQHPWASWAAQEPGDGSMPGGHSRWNANKDLSFQPVRPVRVAEVRYVTMTNGRFRGVAHFNRWRPDRDADSCNYDQLDEITPMGVSELLT
jgi:ATP-dependent DNA ligase